MSQRFLKIKNFKNIGITKEEDQWERLYLNNSLDKDKIGELIILIGENNVGKSNILDAINIINIASKSKKPSNFKNCLPDFMGYNDCLPELKLVYIDDENNSYDLELNIDDDGNSQLINNLPTYTTSEVIPPKFNLENIKKEIENKLNSYSKETENYTYSYSSNFTNEKSALLKKYKTIIDNSKNIFEELKGLYSEIQTFFENFIYEYNRRYNSKIKDLQFVDLNSIAYTKEKKIEKEEPKDIIKEKYDIDFIPNISFYEEKHIEDKDLIAAPEKIKDSKFFNSLFKAINYKTSVIATAYEKSKINPGYKDQYQDDINEKLKDIVSKRFNELYFQALGTQEYSFEIKLEKDEIFIF